MNSPPPLTTEAFFASADQNETVDNLYCLCAELEKKVIDAENCLVCAVIGDKSEVIDNTLWILSRRIKNYE